MYRSIILIFLLAIGLRIGYLVLLTAEHSSETILTLFPDSQNYVQMAQGFLSKAPQQTNIMNDYFLLLWGPGYAWFLNVCFRLFGVSAWPILVIQSIISSLNALLIFFITRWLFPSNTRLAVLAGILSAISLTSITLSCSILSETFFMCLFLGFCFCFLYGLEKGHWIWFTISGILLGCSGLVRTIAQFYPILVLIIGWLILRLRTPESRPGGIKKMFPRVIFCALLAILIMSVWVARNYSKHKICVLSEAGYHNAKYYLAAKTYAEIHGLDVGEIKTNWTKQDYLRLQQEKISIKDLHHERIHFILRLIRYHPWAIIKSFITSAWANMYATDYLHYVQLRQEWWKGIDPIYRWADHICFLFVTLGILKLFLAREYIGLCMILSIYAYFALFSGFNFWQGSRILFPTQISWNILLAIGLHWITSIVAGFNESSDINASVSQ
jgi:4-amino-4-deoxy-L-arabinose transferase-like glycosyltransferase